MEEDKATRRCKRCFERHPIFYYQTDTGTQIRMKCNYGKKPEVVVFAHEPDLPIPLIKSQRLKDLEFMREHQKPLFT